MGLNERRPGAKTRARRKRPMRTIIYSMFFLFFVLFPHVQAQEQEAQEQEAQQLEEQKMKITCDGEIQICVDEDGQCRIKSKDLDLPVPRGATITIERKEKGNDWPAALVASVMILLIGALGIVGISRT